jgi:hypothetical protein
VLATATRWVERPRSRRLRLACAAPDVVTSAQSTHALPCRDDRLLAACGDNLAGPVAAEDYPAAVREAVCRQLTRCGEIESFKTCLTTQIIELFAFVLTRNPESAQRRPMRDQVPAE